MVGLLFVAVTTVLALNAVSKLLCLYWLSYAPTNSDTQGIGLWGSERPPVLLQYDSNTRYGLDAEAEWAALVPHDGIMHVGADRAPYTVSMLHQLRCIDVMRAQLLLPRVQRDMARTAQCMNYVRQMSLCHQNTFLDPFQYAHKIAPVDPHPVRRCRDWRAVYEEVAQNERDYVDWLGTGDSSEL
ncbi:hypothetical protein B0H21DRAFT_747371 [Amylocystis lapponica]|nr:hypothetical protein B0H21DRAFT_747371 [Amylocystis lapponica]